jgi:hypothetical protein
MDMMHISRDDLNLLTVFEAIFSQGGVTRAGAAARQDGRSAVRAPWPAP